MVSKLHADQLKKRGTLLAHSDRDAPELSRTKKQDIA